MHATRSSLGDAEPIFANTLVCEAKLPFVPPGSADPMVLIGFQRTAVRTLTIAPAAIRVLRLSFSALRGCTRSADLDRTADPRPGSLSNGCLLRSGQLTASGRTSSRLMYASGTILPHDG